MVTVTTGSLSRVFVAVFAWFAFGLSIGSYSFVHAYQDGWVRVEVARDTWVSDFSSERNGSNGAAPRLKLKSIQELSIIDFQPGEFKGKEIAEAKLMLKVAADKPIERVTLSTITTDWVEGNGTSYQVVPGASTFRHRSHPKETWYGSDFTAVCIGQGNSLYASVDAKPAKESGWVELDIPPELLLARLHGLSYGIVLMDDTGSTWTRKGDEFKLELFPNRYVYSRDSNRSSSPYIRVRFAPNKPAEPKKESLSSLKDLRYLPPEKQDPRPRLQWQFDTTALTNVIGFRATMNGEAVGPYWVPSIRSHRKGVFTMPLEELLANDSGTSAKFSIAAVSKSGVMSDTASIEVPILKKEELPALLKPIPKGEETIAKEVDWSGGISFGKSKLSVIDPLDIYVSKGRQLTPGQRQSYLSKNHLWDSSQKLVTLDLARGAWGGFQLITDSPIDCKLNWSWVKSPNGNSPAKSITEFYGYGEVPVGDASVPDPLIPLMISGGAASSDAVQSSGQSVGDKPYSHWLVENYVPPEVSAGEYEAVLKLQQEGETLELKVLVRIHDVVIPKTLSFLPEMNCYGLPPNDIDYYRLAQRHRTFINRVPYGQNGKMADGCAPEWRAGQLDWTAWDKRFGGLFTGKAFEDLPRGAVPIESFYLPMHENWPLPIDPNYNGSYWADQAFTPEYRDAWVSSVRQTMDHVQDRGWKETRFHVFLNNKNSFKANGWSRGSSPWLLDEPANFQDYIALRYFGLAYLEGVQQAECMRSQKDRDPRDWQGVPRVVYRADISRPQWQRDTLDEMLQYNVVAGGAFKEYSRLVLDRKFRFGQEVVVYGSNNPVGTNNATAVAWSWDSWCNGVDGVLPWQTIGNSNSWTKGDELSLFYPSRDSKDPRPLPSIRLKAYCYGEQDVEVLKALAEKIGPDRYQFGRRLLKSLQFQSVDRAQGDYIEPASWSDYGRLTPEMLHAWRIQIMKLASAK